MTSIVWDSISTLAQQIENKFRETGTKIAGNEHSYSWYNSIYTSEKYRRAHIEIVDNRQTHKIYILHCTIFPHFNDNSPIWGFDAVCGPNKITGAFHDFSSGGNDQHEMIGWFADHVKNISWRKERQLPDWALQIFSKHMVAAGNINEENELAGLCNLGLGTLDYYLANVGSSRNTYTDSRLAQNRYCHYQKQNPHVVNSMVAMGVPRETMLAFVDEILFPET